MRIVSTPGAPAGMQVDLHPPSGPGGGGGSGAATGRALLAAALPSNTSSPAMDISIGGTLDQQLTIMCEWRRKHHWRWCKQVGTGGVPPLAVRQAASQPCGDPSRPCLPGCIAAQRFLKVHAPPPLLRCRDAAVCLSGVLHAVRICNAGGGNDPHQEHEKHHAEKR